MLKFRTVIVNLRKPAIDSYMSIFFEKYLIACVMICYANINRHLAGPHW